MRWTKPNAVAEMLVLTRVSSNRLSLNRIWAALLCVGGVLVVLGLSLYGYFAMRYESVNWLAGVPEVIELEGYEYPRNGYDGREELPAIGELKWTEVGAAAPFRSVIYAADGFDRNGNLLWLNWFGNYYAYAGGPGP